MLIGSCQIGVCAQDKIGQNDWYDVGPPSSCNAFAVLGKVWMQNCNNFVIYTWAVWPYAGG